jgi:hypothetical protein
MEGPSKETGIKHSDNKHRTVLTVVGDTEMNVLLRDRNVGVAENSDIFYAVVSRVADRSSREIIDVLVGLLK